MQASIPNSGPNNVKVRLQYQMILWTFALVFTLGAISFLVLVQPPQSLAAAYASASKLKAGATRVPASLGTNLVGAFTTTTPETISANDKNQAMDLEINCAGNQLKEVSEKISQVRILGSACSKVHDAFATSEILNEANGFTATVFFREAGNGPDQSRNSKLSQFSTDYITLAAGENKIRILHTFKKGTREIREYIVRRL